MVLASLARLHKYKRLFFARSGRAGLAGQGRQARTMNVLLELLLVQIPVTCLAAAIATAQFVTASGVVQPLATCLYFVVAWVVTALLVLTLNLLVALLGSTLLEVLGVLGRR